MYENPGGPRPPAPPPPLPTHIGLYPDTSYLSINTLKSPYQPRWNSRSSASHIHQFNLWWQSIMS